MRTQRKAWGAVGVLASCVLGGSPSAQAQEFHVPRFYITQGQHAAGAAVPDGFLTRTVTVHLNTAPTDCPAATAGASAARCAAADALDGPVSTGWPTGR